MTDREKLIDNLRFLLECELAGDCSHLAIEWADHLLANGVTFQKWIPVTERLPEDDLPKNSEVKQIKVFVAYKTNGRWVTRTQIRAKGYFCTDKDRWNWVKVSDPITHWMPLPNPPKENADEVH